jgi:Fe-S cluster assembly iron-binding protein IscA
MLTVTKAAKDYLKEKLETNTKNPKACTRLIPVPPENKQLSLVLDEGGENKGDQVIEHDGVTVMAVAPELEPMLNGITLDVKDTDKGQQLVITKE